ncbi:MAG: hypothetical protein ACR2OO_07555 [Thermomicrobiales bacterium]
MSAPAPELAERRAEPKRGIRVANVQRPGQGIPEIAVLAIQACQPDRMVEPAQACHRLLGQRQEMGGVGAPGGPVLPGGGEPLQAVFPDRLQHADPRLAVVRLLEAQQARVDERGDLPVAPDDRIHGRGQGGRGRDGGHRVQRDG